MKNNQPKHRLFLAAIFLLVVSGLPIWGMITLLGPSSDKGAPVTVEQVLRKARLDRIHQARILQGKVKTYSSATNRAYAGMSDADYAALKLSAAVATRKAMNN